MAYIALDRQFIESDDSEDAEEAAAESLAYRILGQEIKWRDVHSHRFVVILGEAGTGKTTEFEEEAQRLQNAGRQAFFIPLEDLADDQITADVRQDVENWKQGLDEGVFFLDAVDEARFGHPAAFRRALDALVRLLGLMKSRSTIVVSCRISDWQYRTDAKTMVATFRSFGPGAASGNGQPTTPLSAGEIAPDATSAITALPPTSDWKPEIKFYQLAPLDSKRIARLAGAWGVADVDRFMAALENTDLQSFAGRPRDLDWLVNYWQQHGAFGSLAEMLEENIRHKLVEHNPAHARRPTGLTPQRCREGVEALAAACVLCERPLIALPDPEIVREPPARSFTPGEVLSGWTPDDIRALLSRAIFDLATFGRVRFHDSTVREYLAARWMANRISAGQRISRVKRLVFGESFGELRPVPSKRAVLGWLVLKSPEILQDAIASAPDVILYCGDASQIPVEERAMALRNLASLLNRVGWTDWTVFDSDVRRIADPRLEPVVRELLQVDTDSYELIRLLLRIVRFGPIPGCADLALNILLDPQRDDGPRIMAAYTVVAAGTAEQHAVLLEYARATEGMSNRILGGFCTALFPDVVNVQECLTIARRAISELPSNTSGIGGYFEHNIIDNCPRQSLQELLVGLLDMARTPPVLDQRGSQAVVSERYAWTVETIFRLLPRILTEQEDGDLDADLITQAYKLVDDCRHNSEFLLAGQDQLKKALTERGILHKPIFWFVVRQRLTRRPGDGRFVWRTHDELLVLDGRDLDWLLDDILTVDDENELDAACETALAIWSLNGCPDEDRSIILEAVEQSAIASDELKQRVRESLWPPPREESDFEREQRERQETRARAEQAALDEIRADLTQRVEDIRTGTYFAGLFQCHQSMRRGAGASSSSWAQSNWPDVLADFGMDITHAAIQGFKISWRGWRPPLPFERGETQIVENGVLTGLTGLKRMARDGDDLSQLSREEAEIATHYAVRELNGFPDWLPDVAEGNPEAVREVLSRQLEAELSAPVDSDVHPDVLSRLRYGPEAIRTLCVDAVLELLTRIDLPILKILSEALEILLLADDAVQARIKPLFVEKAQHYASTEDDDRLFLWLEVWLHVDAIPAVQFLEDLFAEGGESPGLIIQKWATSVGQRYWEKREPGNADYFQPQALERLILLVNAHIRIEDDPDHDGVYEIDEREHAQNLRGALSKYLANQTGADAQHILQNLAASFDNQPETQAHFRRLAEQQAALTMEYPPWSPSDVADFTAREMEPRTGDDLYEIALDRLEDIKDDIETGDFSDRDLFPAGMPEKNIQRWLAGRLRHSSQGKYSVTREEEIDRSQETDIRLHHSAAGCITIEIKPVERETSRYSFNQLVAALREQLVGQYMRAAESNHGILVVAMLETRQWNPPEGGRRIGFSEVLDRLNAIASEIVQSDPGVEKLSVIGIDFS